jgi:putative hydrolase of the HAD superfamily
MSGVAAWQRSLHAECEAVTKAVLWDLGGVILRTEDRRPRAAWEARLGLQEGELDRLVFGGEMGRRAALGQAEVEQVWQWVGEQLGLAPDNLERLRHDFWRGDRLDGELTQFIRGLRRNHRSALLSNAWPGMRQMIEGEWAISDCFDQLFISAELGLAKPDPRIFRLALERLGIPAVQAIFVDDFSENVEAAIALGLHAIRFVTPGQTMQEVRQQLAAGA